MARMANMSNDFIRVSKGYAEIKTQFGMPVKVYCELWASMLCNKLTLKVFPKAPKGYHIESIDYPDTFDKTSSCIVAHNSVNRDWDINIGVQAVCNMITMYVGRTVTGPLGIVVTNSRLGVVHASCGRFVSYADAIDAYNCAYNVADNGDIITVTISTADEAEEALAMIEEDRPHWIFYDSAELMWGVK